MSDIQTQAFIVSQIYNQKEKGNSGASGHWVSQSMSLLYLPFYSFVFNLAHLQSSQKKKKRHLS